MSEMARVLVTGASGFLGRRVVAALGAEDGVTAVPADIDTGCDILDMDSLRALPAFDVVIHLAARTFIPDSYRESRAFYETNVMGTANCLELCKEREAALVLASTYVYGKPDYLPVDEAHPVRKWNPYSTSKILAEELCEAYSAHFDVSTRILRLFNLFGEGHASCFLIPKIVEGLRAGSLSLMSSKPRRDYVYVDDVVRAMQLSALTPWTGCERFNVGTGVSHSVAEVVDAVRDALGTAAAVEYSGEERPGEVMDVVADISRIKEHLNWTPRYDLRSGLEAYLAG